jgi:hypothetical protein
MDDIGFLGYLLYAPLVIALVASGLLLRYAVKRKKYWAGIIAIAVAFIFLSIYFYG